MNPMTELDVLKGLQASIAGLDLESPMAVESAMALGASMERSAGRIVSPDRCACGEDCVHPSHHTGNDAMRAICAEPPFSEEPFADDIARTIAARKIQVNTPAEDAQMDEIEARQVDLAKPEVFDIVGFTQTYFNKAV